jgi:Protein of unknown function (DUF3349)
VIAGQTLRIRPVVFDVGRILTEPIDLNWLRVGYPDGVPGPDRVPLLALLRATPLTEDQIKEVVRNITADGSTATADGSIDADEIAAFIKDVTHHDAGPENVQRVAAKLAAAGWPLAGVDHKAD